MRLKSAAVTMIFHRHPESMMTTNDVIASAIVTSLLDCARLCTAQRMCQAFSSNKDMLCVFGSSYKNEDVISPNKVELYIERR